MTPKYRPDIDGLRAVAVLSVLFYHSGSSIFSGGYVGVDVFFVISGYLITTIIVREIENKEFSITKFYERRFRRILPALTVVVAVSLALGYLLFYPNRVVSLGESAISTALFYSNIFFFIKSGYFDTAAEMKPLLHTWSLAVEEQYYIFFPLLLILIEKFDAKNYLKWLVILGVLSLVACVSLTHFNASAAFYLIPTRSWELFIGSILALHVIPVTKRRYLNEIISMLGIAMIAYSVFQYTSETDFPGIAAVLPTIGTSLVIYSGSGGHTLVSTIMSLRPVVFVGLISYSLYLWHWPVIVFTKTYFIKTLTEPVIFMMLITVFVISILSWKYVELPFRKKALIKKRRSLLGVSAFVMLAIVGSGLAFIINEGFPRRLANTSALDTDINDAKWHHWGACQRVVSKIKNGQSLCDIGEESQPTSFILWGDSQARGLASGVDMSAKHAGVKGKIATQAGCPPLLSIERSNRTSCNEFNQAVLKYISNTPEIETVILAARWAISTTGTRYKHESGGPVQLVAVNSVINDHLSNSELFEIGLIRTVEQLHNSGKKVVLVNPVPEVGYDVPSVHFIAHITSRETDKLIAPTIEEYKSRTKEVISIFDNLKDKMSIEIVSPEVYLCDNSYCRVVVDDVPLYRDDNHLSTFGSEYISTAFDEMFNKTAIRVAEHYSP